MIFVLAYFQVLSEKSTETKLKILHLYLPLLRLNKNPSLNEKLKDAYNDLLQTSFETCLQESSHLNECYELAVLASLHPIFDAVQESSFKKWTQLFMQESRVQSNIKQFDEHHKQEEKNNISDYDLFENNKSVYSSSNNTVNSLVEINKRSLMRRHLPLEKTTSLPPVGVNFMSRENSTSKKCQQIIFECDIF